MKVRLLLFLILFAFTIPCFAQDPELPPGLCDPDDPDCELVESPLDNGAVLLLIAGITYRLVRYSRK